MSNQNSPVHNFYNRDDVNDETDTRNDKKILKIARIVGVCLYIFSVSFLALALSCYYIFFWNSNTKVVNYPIRPKHLIDDSDEIN
jgi:hypothetical protein